MTWPEAFAVVGMAWAFAAIVRAACQSDTPHVPRPRLSDPHPGAGQLWKTTTTERPRCSQTTAGGGQCDRETLHLGRCAAGYGLPFYTPNLGNQCVTGATPPRKRKPRK